jgi:pilus assembly protein Flp/PilA
VAGPTDRNATNREGAPWMMFELHPRGHLDDRGQGLAEYALILALIAIVAILALTFLGTQISQILSYIGSAI